MLVQRTGSTKLKLTSSTAILLYIALADFVFHMLIAGNYGYFRDELYYIVAGERLAFGYVDFPPVIALFAALVNVIAGDSLVSIHVIPAIAAAAIVFLAGKIASEFGGGLRAQVLTAVAAMFSASFAVASIFSMDVLDVLWWTLLAYILVRIIRRGNRDPKLWLLFGVVAGIGLMTKLTIAFFLLSVLVAFLIAKRSYLKSPWVWVGAVIALAILSPYVIWNASKGWPTVDFFIHHGGLNGGGPLSFLANQILIAGFLGLPLAIIGLYFFFRTPSGRPYALLGISFIVLLIVFTVTNGKPYFIMGAYPFVFAAGSVLVEKRRWVWRGYLTGIVIIGILLAPIYAPVLPPQTFVKYYGGLTSVANGASAQGNAGAFPQYLGDRFGWNTMTATVAQAYYSLPPQEKSQACILTENYGEASALTFLGKPYKLPPVISGHNNYYIWGPDNCTGQVLIIIGYYPSDFQPYFAKITVAGNITCVYCMTSEDNLPVIIATGLNGTVGNAWAGLKHFN
jgi:4-amino-4-deoxy-L-arabinose transferase-like glycosyltransferase